MFYDGRKVQHQQIHDNFKYLGDPLGGCKTWAWVVLCIKICRSGGVSFESQDSKIYKIRSTLPCRGVAKGNQLTLFKPGGGADYAPHTTTNSPRFKELSTPLP